MRYKARLVSDFHDQFKLEKTCINSFEAQAHFNRLLDFCNRNTSTWFANVTAWVLSNVASGKAVHQRSRSILGRNALCAVQICWRALFVMLVGLVACYRLCGLCSLTCSKLHCSVSHGGARARWRKSSRKRRKRKRRSSVAQMDFSWHQFLLMFGFRNRFDFGKAAGLCAVDPEELQLAAVNSSLQNTARSKNMRNLFLGPHWELPLQYFYRISDEICTNEERTKCICIDIGNALLKNWYIMIYVSI